MEEELKEKLINTVQSAADVLDIEDALSILAVCRRAADRAIANATEQYLTECIRRGDDE